MFRVLRNIIETPPEVQPAAAGQIETGPAGVPRYEVEFSGYTEDCRIFAFVHVDTERMSAYLDERDEYELNSVLLVALEDSRAVETERLIVRRDELVAVRASGPRGNPQRRRRTRPAPVGMRAGPYTIRGYLHTPPGSDPLEQFRRRRMMVPLTESWIEYMANGATHRARVGTIIVNRDFVDWIDHARDAEVRQDLPVEMRLDPRAKDMTGLIRVWRS
ncbi:MAG TPA: hypothetical protein VMP67_02250 [Candidatus Limnocylindria bacterium]|nr:hypothetical protein [Candidatus Limnocylindria bacterium]